MKVEQKLCGVSLRLLNKGNDIYKLAERLFPINRSITGEGVEQTLSILQNIVPEIAIHKVPTGHKVLDWEIPKEWNVKDAWVKYLHKDGKEELICSFKNSLHNSKNFTFRAKPPFVPIFQ